MKINKTLLATVLISLMCLSFGCDDTVPTQTEETSETLGTSENVSITTTINTTIVTTSISPVSTYSPNEYKSNIQNIINNYESMLINLNSLTNAFDTSSEWTSQLTQCFKTSKYYQDTLQSMVNEGTVPIKYQKSHENLLYCMEHYTASISLIQQAVNYYLDDEEEQGDYCMIQAINRSDLANSKWKQIRGYGVSEYTGETLSPQSVTSSYSGGGAITNFTYETATTVTYQTYEEYNDGYSFDGNNVFIYGE